MIFFYKKGWLKKVQLILNSVHESVFHMSPATEAEKMNIKNKARFSSDREEGKEHCEGLPIKLC